MRRKVQRSLTFAELAARPTWSETEASADGEHAVRPGRFNLSGDLFSPDGRPLRRRRSEVSPRQAQKAVDAGALVVAEGCGCGGGISGCELVWLGEDDLRALRGGPPPRFTDRYGSPTWIDVWDGHEVAVVFVHGDVDWGGSALG